MPKLEKGKKQGMECKIRDTIQRGEYDAADRLLRQYLEHNQPYTPTIAILDGSIGGILGERKRLWKAVKKGLQMDPENYELYVMLGNYYLEENLKQAFLCYENALFYCGKEEDREAIRGLMDSLREEYGVKLPKVAIIILSYNLLDYTRQCIESIRKNTTEESREIIVIDNASVDGSVEWLRKQKDIKLLCNAKNRGFPEGCNQGIELAEKESDIFLLNNDTIVPPNALFWLRMGLYENERVGSTGSVSNRVPNLQQVNGTWKSVEEILAYAKHNNVPTEYPYEEKIFLIGFAMLIKRQVMNEIGGLDEVFSPGNSEDVDYGLRVLEAGYHNVLCRNSFIIHFGSKSFGKLGKGFAEILQKNHSILNKKWGIALEHYLFPRLELIDLIQEKEEAPIKVLDIGCGCGASLARIRSIYPNSRVFGITLMKKTEQLAKTIGKVICTEAEEPDLPYPDNYFDYCILGDILGQVKEPEILLQKLKRCMKTEGHIIVSVPNIKHWSIFLPLLKDDRFNYRNSGILSPNCQRMYTGKEIQKLISERGYQIKKLLYKVGKEPPEGDKRVLEELVQYMDSMGTDSFMAYQYIVEAQVIKE